jgi:glyoxylase-like metal-dependent hydrolase (beta-lactamase superfamily II)
MKIHHLNCGSMCPIAGRLLPNIFPKEICCHCLFIETSDKLILVDAGHFSHDVRWSEFDSERGENWNGFECVNLFPELPPEILLVRLPGHTPGHFGIAVQTGAKWLLHAGDAYYDYKELLNENSSLGLRLFQRVAHTNYKTAMATQSALADLKSKPDVLIFSSHDPTELPLEAI